MGSLKTDIIINVNTNETRIAILEEGRLVELLVERPEKERTVGNIYKGVVTDVLPGMQAAFVDIGLERTAFLPASDVADTFGEYSALLDLATEEEEEEKPTTRERKPTSIDQLLKEEQQILVQITKEAIGTKGPRLTTQISLPGRFLVLVPSQERIGVSRKIESRTERRRLRKLAAQVKPDGMGLIVRTVAEGKGEKEFQSDIKTLLKLWKKIDAQAAKVKAPALIHKDMGITSSIIRDLFTPDVNQLVIDSKKEYKRILSYLNLVSPELKDRVKLYRESIPIFDAYGIEKEIDKALNRRIWLKGGGYIVIDHTEALVTIDVNTGKYVGKEDLRETVLKTNLEAAREIARQLRLRDIGGLIVIDFIDMESPEHQALVVNELRAALRRDRAKSSISPISEFGLVEMTRQRIRPSLFYTFSEPCPMCQGSGRVLSPETVTTKIERWLKRARAGSNERDLKLMVHPSVAQYLLENDQAKLKRLAKEYKVKIELVKDDRVDVEEFRFLSLKRDVDITDEFKA